MQCDNVEIMKYLNTLLTSVQTMSIGLLIFLVLVFSWGGTLQGQFFEKFSVAVALIIFGVFLWIFEGFMRGRLQVKITPLHGLLFAFFGVIGLSAIFSVDQYRSVWGIYNDPFLGIIGYGALIVMFLWISSRPVQHTFHAGAVGYLIGGGMLSTLVVLQGVFGMNAYIPYVSFPDDSSATLGILLVVQIFMLFWALSWEKRSGGFLWGLLQKIGMFLLFGLLFADLFALGIIFENILWIPLGLGVGSIVLFLTARRIHAPRKLIGALLLSFSMLIAFPFFSVFSTLEKEHTVLNEKRPSLGMAWSVSWGALFHKPILGYGPGTYAYVYDANVPASVNETDLYGARFLIGRGLLFDIVTTTGLLGLLTFLLIVAVYIGALWHYLKDASSFAWSTILSFGSTLAILTLALLWTLNGVMVFLLFFFMGLTFASSQSGQSVGFSRDKTCSLRVNPQYAISITLLALGVLSGVGVLGFRLYSSALSGVYAQRAASREFSMQEQFLAQASEKTPLEVLYQQSLAELYLRQAISVSSMEDIDVSKLEAVLNKAFASAEKAKELAPYDAGVAVTVATVYDRAGQYVSESFDLATEEYARASILAPSNPLFPYKEGLIALDQARRSEEKDPAVRNKNFRRAQELFEKSIELAPHFSSAYFQLGVAHKELGEMDEAEKYARRAIELSPNNVDSILGLVLILLQDESRGVEIKTLLDRALFLDPKSVAARLYLGQWQAREGLSDEARESYEWAKENLGGTQEGVEQYIDTLIADLDAEESTDEEVSPDDTTDINAKEEILEEPAADIPPQETL